MAVIRNPKMEGTNLWDCVPQSGKCPMIRNQCYFNRPDAYYTATPSVPTPGGSQRVGIVP